MPRLPWRAPSWEDCLLSWSEGCGCWLWLALEALTIGILAVLTVASLPSGRWLRVALLSLALGVATVWIITRRRGHG